MKTIDCISSVRRSIVTSWTWDKRSKVKVAWPLCVKTVPQCTLLLHEPCCTEDIQTVVCRTDVVFDQSSSQHVRVVRCHMTSWHDAVTSRHDAVQIHTRHRAMMTSTGIVHLTPPCRRYLLLWTMTRRGKVSTGWRNRGLDRLYSVVRGLPAGPRTVLSTAMDSWPTEDRTAASAALRRPSLWRNTAVPVMSSAEAEVEMACRRMRTWRAAVAARRVLRCRLWRGVMRAMTSSCCGGVNEL